MNENRRVLREIENLIIEYNKLENKLEEIKEEINLLEIEYLSLKDEQINNESELNNKIEKENIKNITSGLIREYFNKKWELDRIDLGIWYLNDSNLKNTIFSNELNSINLFLNFLGCNIEYSSLNFFDTQIKINYNMGDYNSIVKLEIVTRPKSVSIDKKTEQGIREVGFCIRRRNLAEFVARLFLEN